MVEEVNGREIERKGKMMGMIVLKFLRIVG